MALVVAALFAGVVAWVVRSRAETPDPNHPKLTIDDTPPPDIKSRPVVTGAGLPGPPEGSKFFAEFADRDDPSRLAGYVKAAKGTPGVGGSYILTEPEFFHYPKDGRLIHFSADKGEVYFPSAEKGTRPESGFFDGRVVCKVFEKPTTGSIADPDRDTPSLVGTTARIEYNGQLGEVLAPEHFEVDGSQGRFVGRNVLLRLSEARQQLMYAFVDPGAVLTIKPQTKGVPAKNDARGTAAVATPAPSKAPSGPDANPATKPPTPPAPKLAYYQIHSKGGVAVTQSARSIRADEANLWLRLIDNKLPAGALGDGARSGADGVSFHSPDAPERPTPKATTSPAPASPNIAIEATSTPATPPEIRHPDPRSMVATDASADAPITISFSGPLEVHLLDEKAPELERDDVLVRFLSGGAGHAEFEDTKAKAKGAGDLIEFGTTSQRLALAGTAAAPAVLALADAGTATSERFDVDLKNGLAAIAGPGTLVAETNTSHADKDDLPRTLTWKSGATLGFATRDGKPTADIEWFKPRGDVAATDRSGSFNAQELDASFEAIPGPSGKRYLKHMVLRDASASDHRQGRVEGREITADFEPTGSGTNSTPTSIALRGNALASSGESILEANAIDATLAKDENGRATVDRAVASGDARFEGRDGVWARAELIEADVPHEVANLSGPDVRLGQRQTFVQGSQMRLEGGERQKLTVFGIGSFEHELLEEGQLRHASASWTRQMTFVDSKGELECAGDVDASWMQGDVSRDQASAERVKMWFTPGGKGTTLSTAITGGATRAPSTTQAPTPANDAKPTAAEPRRLLRAEAIGSNAEREGGAPASIESRRFALVDGKPTLERLLYVEGDTIKADNEAGTLDVPGPGRLFTMDHRATQARVQALINQPRDQDRNQPLAALANDTNGARGEAKFEWKGSLKADKGAKTITLHEGVKLRHHRSQDGLLTDLECQDLLAMLGESKPGATSQAKDAKDLSGDLMWAMAKGGVWLRSGTREITGAQLLYDAANGLVDAMAPEDSKVTIFDQGTATPLSAKRILWNLSSGRLEVKEPGTIVAPR